MERSLRISEMGRREGGEGDESLHYVATSHRILRQARKKCTRNIRDQNPSSEAVQRQRVLAEGCSRPQGTNPTKLIPQAPECSSRKGAPLSTGLQTSCRGVNRDCLDFPPHLRYVAVARHVHAQEPSVSTTLISRLQAISQALGSKPFRTTKLEPHLRDSALALLALRLRCPVVGQSSNPL